MEQSANGVFPDVCVACATPPGSSGLAIIRIDGSGSPELVSTIFRSNSGKWLSLRDMPGHTCRVGRIVDPESGELIDEVVLTRFEAPRSYTGEDLIEISCHGGVAVKQAIIRALCLSGARLAEPGEFTRRAFLNGKIDLSQAEAVMDLISATAGRAAAAAARQLEGGLMRLVRSHMDQIYGLMARVELILDFPEHDDLSAANLGLANDLETTACELDALAATFRQGRVLREGLTVVIAGRPNVGKSSLLNNLAGYDRAIVTDIPGTTRDTVEELTAIEGIPVRLIDTAGLRETSDQIEKLGMDRTRSAIEEADLVFYLISPPWDQDSAEEELNAVREIAVTRPVILLCGKADLPEREMLADAILTALPELPVKMVSTVTGEGCDEIRQAILETYQVLGVSGTADILITNLRHYQQILLAAHNLKEAATALTVGIPLDVAATPLRSAADALGEITGDSVGEILIETIFSRFCVGK